VTGQARKGQDRESAHADSGHGVPDHPDRGWIAVRIALAGYHGRVTRATNFEFVEAGSQHVNKYSGCDRFNYIYLRYRWGEKKQRK
jgi:hypothetical protein